MFCHKCGSQVADGAAFCHKCGAKILYEDAAQQPADTLEPDGELQQTGAAESIVTEDTDALEAAIQAAVACVSSNDCAV